MSLENKIDMKEETDNYYYNPNWENWTLYKAIPTTLTIAAGLAGGYFVGSYFGNRNLKTENQVLKTEVQSLKVHLKELQNIGLRLTDLEQVIGLSQETNQELISKLSEPKPVAIDDREHVEGRHVQWGEDDGAEHDDFDAGHSGADSSSEPSGTEASEENSGAGESAEHSDGDEGSEHPSAEASEENSAAAIGGESVYNNFHSNAGEYHAFDINPMRVVDTAFEYETIHPNAGEYGVSQNLNKAFESSKIPQTKGRTPAKEFNPFAATKAISRTPAVKGKGSAEVPQTPGGTFLLASTKKAVDIIIGTAVPKPSIAALNRDIDRFMGKFSDSNGYVEGNRKILKDGLSILLKSHFKEGASAGQVYSLLDDIFKDDNTLSIKKDSKGPAQFTEIFDALKDGTLDVAFQKGTINRKFSAFKSVNKNDPFGLGDEATTEILSHDDVNSAHLLYLLKVITATVIASSMVGAEGYEMDPNENMISDDFDHEDLSNREDEASDDEITAQAESEQNSIVIKVEEVTFNEKFISLLPWYGKIVATSAASSVVKTSAAGAWQYFTYNTASEAVEIVGDAVVSAAFGVSLPKGCVGAFATPIASMAVFEAIYGQAEAAFNYVCSAPEALEAAGQEGIAYSA